MRAAVVFLTCSLLVNAILVVVGVDVRRRYEEAAFCDSVVLRWMRFNNNTDRDDWMWERYGATYPNRYTKAQTCLSHYLGTMGDRQ